MVRLLAGRPVVDDGLQAEWLRRGRAFLQAFRDLESSSPYAGMKMPDKPWVRSNVSGLDIEGTTPASIRESAYRVEARRCILRSLAAWSKAGVFAVALTGLATSATSSLWMGGTITIAGFVAVGLVHAWGLRMSRRAVPLHQGLEPLVWALYCTADLPTIWRLPSTGRPTTTYSGWLMGPMTAPHSTSLTSPRFTFNHGR